MFILICICVLFGRVSSQPSGGLHGGPIEAECLSFLRRERIWVPVTLEHLSNPTTGPSNNPISLARHHIIPLRTLRSFFDTAVTMNHEGNVELTGLMSLVGFLANDALNRFQGPDDLERFVRSDLENMRELRDLYIDQEHNLNNPSVDILFSAQYLVRSMYQWIPANIFIGPGPQRRSDDPGDSFELNSRYIIGEEAYSRLVTINRMMNSYVETHERATYNEVIELLSEISCGRITAYPFNIAQWIYNRNDNKYRINTNPNNRSKRQTGDVTFVGNDPYCLRPLETIKMTIKEDNLMVVSEVIDRVIKHKGFYRKNYDSWKEWYEASSWDSGIYNTGLSMAGEGLVNDPYGYTFNDNSFSVGILGTDAKGKKDNWVNLDIDFRNITYKRQFAGQAYFDKDGRPVAIVITSLAWSEHGFGWSYIYNDRKWEYERTDTWDKRRFAGRTTSLDSTALMFVKS